MTDYISREAAIENVIDQLRNGGKSEQCIRERLLNLEPADVRETRRGKWTLNRDGSGTCSECHYTIKDVWDMDGWVNFCSHCGADMRNLQS